MEVRKKVRENEARRSIFNLNTLNTDKKDILALEHYEKLSREVENLKKETELAKEIEETRYEEKKKLKSKLL